ncbi:SprT family zinc-dependent metalloprotease [Gemmobacter sp. 24YEA27]|uniref:M48 family metallopeptidase n=1 Tax=Gemmobacter sp. 24YEA27 TaxID=3040672 RepID=UPI0024B3649C|nr:SprT family zinc-dependent metalloprotease [Gemmobacter sp. 24YEA27]
MLLLPGPPPVEINMRRSARAKRFSLRVSRLDGKVTLTLPPRAKDRDALSFLHDQEGWLRTVLASMPMARLVPVSHGAELPVLGRMMRITPSEGRGVRVEGDSLLVPGRPDQAGAKVAAWLKALARDRLAYSSTHYAGLVGRSYARLVLRDTRSRWGSCSHDGTLMYSWRLAMAPREVLDYVAAHEVAHLVEMNHSADFWAVVSKIRPGWKAERDWLKRDGQTLHRYSFAG